MTYHKKYREENKDKYRATNKVNNAIRDGKLEKHPCEMCGSTRNIHGHHVDYSKPLEVNWLCCICHKAEHLKHEESYP